MRTVEKAIHAFVADHQNWKTELHNFLRVYRSTPHCSTSVSPFELLFGRPMNIKLPEMHDIVKPQEESVRCKDKAAKEKMKKNADLKRHTKPRKLKVGDTVLVRRDKKNKLSTPY